MITVSISAHAHDVFLEYARRRGISFAEAADAAAALLTDRLRADESAPAPMSLSRRHLAERFFSEAQVITPTLRLVALTGDENAQIVRLTIAERADHADAVEVALRYAEMDQQANAYMGARLLLARLQVARAAASLEESDTATRQRTRTRRESNAP